MLESQMIYGYSEFSELWLHTLSIERCS